MEELNHSIGGYFELELSKGVEYHNECISLNSARNALEYILKTENYKKVFLPYFTCDVVLEPFHKLKIDFEFYKIDENLEPVFDYSKVFKNEAFLYTNYFGIKDDFIKTLSNTIENLIIDNAQAFYSEPLKGIATFYSPRKFFGVSDGSYLYTNKKISDVLEQDFSFNKMSHLLIRADINAERGYQNFLENDKVLIGEPIKEMSNLTKKILQSIDYDKVKLQRIKNFNYLHNILEKRNLLNIIISDKNVPMVYPFWSKDEDIKAKLLKKQIYCATYWPNVKEWCDKDDLETKLMNQIVHLPIDQRYTKDDMELILEIINNGI